jgi:hypothetical protein
MSFGLKNFFGNAILYGSSVNLVEPVFGLLTLVEKLRYIVYRNLISLL